MSDVWKGWTLTEEQRLKMVEGDREALDRFYFDNYNQLFALAKSYAHQKYKEGFGDIYIAEELFQDLYIGLPRLSYENPAYLTQTIHQWFYMVRYGGRWAKPYISQEQIDGESRLFYMIDRPLHSNNTDSDMRYIDKYCSYRDPYQELLYYKEQARLNKLEEDLERFLKELFTEKQFEKWQAGHNRPDVEIKLRKNADAVIAFLRAHGTPERFLQRERLRVVTQVDPERKARAKARRELWEWQINHLDELDEETRADVERRLKWRAYDKTRREREKARESV